MAAMICPQCGSEYRLGIKRCMDCDATLVGALGDGAARPLPDEVAVRRPRATYGVLAAASGLVLLLVAPEILFAFGLSNETELQVAATEAGIFLGLPAAAAVVLALVLSVMDVVRGPASVRRRIGLWWAIPVLGMALSWTTSLSDGRAGSGLLLLLVLAVPFGLAVDWILSAPPPQP